MATSSTNNYHFPYPLGSDSLSNVALRIQELAEFIDTSYTILGIDLTGSAALLQAGDAAGGALTGTYPNPTLNPSIVLPDGMRATTQAQSDGSTKVATTAYVDAYITGTIPDGSISTAELADGAVTDAKVNAAAAISYSKLNLTGTILNADLAGSIAYSKLSLTNTIVNADVATSAAIAYSKLNLATSIVNADIAAGAAIVDTKLATIGTAGKVSNTATTATDANTASAIVARDASGNFTAGMITANVTGALTGNASTVTTNANLTGDVTSVGNATSIASGVIVNADVNASAAIDKTKISGTAVTLADTGTVTSTMIANDTIINADINSAAAISYSKLSLGTSIVNADISTSAAIAYSKLALTGAILNADLAGSIAPSKITGTAVITTDSRLSDARTPTAHASTHIPGGTDVLDYTKIVGYGTALPTWSGTTHPAGVLWVVNTVGEPYSLYRSDGVSAWKQVGGGGASVTASDTAPSSPTSGALWFDSTTGKTFIWYVDGSSNQWVEVGEASQLSVPSHGSSHVRGGSDVIDGDRVSVDFVPARYSRNSGASGAGDVTDLTAHLSGIDTSLNSIWVPPMVRCAQSTATTLTSGAETVITFNGTDEYDTYGQHDPTTNNTRVTIPITGVYMLQGCVHFLNGTTQAAPAFRKNGTTGLGSGTNIAATTYSSSMACTAYLTTSDYVEFLTYCGNANSTYTPGTWMAVTFIGKIS